MNDVPENSSAIKNYLLGTLSDEEALRRIEEGILLSDDFDEKVSTAEDELIDEYLDGMLTADEEKRFREFFLAAPERREKFRLIRDLKELAGRSKADEPAAARQRSSFFEWFLTPAFLRFAVIVLLAGGAGLVVWRTVFYETETEKGLKLLASAYRGERPFESRLTGNFSYARYSVTRGEQSSDAATDPATLRLAESSLLKAATENPSDARARHALGLFYLSEKQFDKALAEFNAAREAAPDDAAVNADIGAAYLEKARRAESAGGEAETMENLARAIEAIDRALAKNPQMTEALFNRALVLEKMNFPDQAREAWEKYLEIEKNPDWATEARQHLERLAPKTGQSKARERVLEDFLDAFRRRDDRQAWLVASQTKEMITGVMIYPQLAKSFLKARKEDRNEEAENFLSAFFYLGRLEEENSGDRYFTELARYYSAASPAQRSLAASAHETLERAFQLLQNSELAAAAADFEKAKTFFIEAGDRPEALIADYQTAYCLSRQNKIPQSNEILFELIRTAENKGYKWLETIARGWAGSNFTLLTEHSTALEYDEKYLALARATANTLEEQKALTQLTQAYWIIGDSVQVLSAVYRNSMVAKDYYSSPRQQARNLIFAAEGMFRAGFYAAAAVFARQQLFLARATGEKSFLHTAHYQLALIYGKIGEFEKSFGEIEECFRIAESTAEPALKKTLTAKTQLVSGHLRREAGDCRRAVDEYDWSIEAYESAGFSINLYEARKGRLLCYIRMQNDEAVKSEMPALLEIFDRYRRTIGEEYKRNLFFDNEQSVYDIAAGYAYARLGDAEQAFDYAENSRARSLLDLINKSQSRPLTLADIRRRMPPETQMLYYSVLPEKILIWHLADENLTVAESPFDDGSLNSLLRNYHSALRKKDAARDETRAAAERLYEILIKPVETALDPKRPVCIVADKALFRLPFASLVAPATGRFLIEDFALFYAPSATVFITESEIAARKRLPSEAETILSVGNPAFSRSAYRELADLPSAETEAAKIAGFYHAPEILPKERAVKDEVVKHLKKADVFHFAGHYVADAEHPFRSKFLLAGGELQVGEIIRENLPRMRLMVLSACGTGVERFYKGEGMVGAARAFLAADVPLVVASQWPVDTDASAELMIRFHDYRKQQNLSSIEALRRAQTAMLRHDNPQFRQPFYWAAFLPIGGFAEY